MLRREAKVTPAGCLFCLILVSYSIFDDVERLRLIALLDAEIARLQQARLLIAPSVISARLRRQPNTPPSFVQPKVEKRVPRRAEEKTPPPSAISAPPEQPVVTITRVPAKERSGRRSSRRMKQVVPEAAIALTGNVPLHPVATPPRRNKEEVDQQKLFRESPVHSSSVSAFGQAISRGLAALKTS
jgi:hypothetical protein